MVCTKGIAQSRETLRSGGPKATTSKGKGTNGGRPVSADKINDAVTVVDKAAGATNEIVTAKEKANKKEAKPTSSTTGNGMRYVVKDDKNPNKNLQVRDDKPEKK